ncbi:MAG: hypothetical protein C4539_08815 [Ignavibacteriales bacterium]|nr:MAG: hypothetical protein C4539_08815 [Ignavibacteriales bacterium]
MKKIKLLIALSVFAFMFSSCSKDEGTASDNANQVQAQKYYPGAVGTSYNYNVTFVNGGGQSKQGLRYVRFTNQTQLGSTTYFVQSNRMIFSDDSTVSTSYFRKTDGGVYFFVDTTGLSNFIPDSLRSVLTVEIDKEQNIFNSTLDKNYPWKVYKMNVKYSNITFSIIDVTASYLGSEDVVLGLNTGNVTKTAEKVKYLLTLSIPDITGTGSSKSGKFTAYGWYVKDLGVVKWDGNVTVLNAVSGNSIDFDDTTNTMTQVISSYDIK